MDKLFWKTIQENKYAIPIGHTPTSLTAELFSYLGSTDAELRDQIAYETFANFLQRDYFSLEEIEIYIANLLANLDIGIGEVESDSVFLRSFSALFLAEIVHNDNKAPRLEGVPSFKRSLKRGCGISLLNKTYAVMLKERDGRTPWPIPPTCYWCWARA